jgi:hypothetical protein
MGVNNPHFKKYMIIQLLNLAPTSFSMFQPSFPSFTGTVNISRTQVIESTYVSNAQTDLQLDNNCYYMFTPVASGSALSPLLTSFVNWLNNSIGQIRARKTNTDRWDDTGQSLISSSGVGLGTVRSNPGVTYQIFSISESPYSGYTFNYYLKASYNNSIGKFTFKQTFEIIGGGYPNTYSNTIPLESISINGLVQYMMVSNIGGTSPTITQASFPVSSIAAPHWRLLANDISWGGPQAYFQRIFLAGMYSTADASGTDLGLSATSYASSDIAGLNGLRAHDGNILTYWESSSAGVEWLRYSFASSVVIRSLRFRFDSVYHSKSYILQYSQDAVNWSDLATIGTSSSLNNQTFLSLQ